MHDVLAKVVGQEAAKLDLLSLADKSLLPESALKALEMLARCAKSLKADPDPPGNVPPPSVEDALKAVEGE